jgi:hypothetical protein
MALGLEVRSLLVHSPGMFGPRVLRRLPVVLLALAALLPACQDTQREKESRMAVKRLVSAPDGKEARELERVVSFGRYTLPDIEQESHAAPSKSRLRLVDAVRRIGSRDALPWLDFLARWDSDEAVRRGAKRAGEDLRSASATTGR